MFPSINVNTVRLNDTTILDDKTYDLIYINKKEYVTYMSKRLAKEIETIQSNLHILHKLKSSYDSELD